MTGIDYAFYLQAITVSASFFLCVDLFMLSILPRSRAIFKLLKTRPLVLEHCLAYSSLVNAAFSAYLSLYYLVKEGVDHRAPNSNLALTIMCVSFAFNITTLLSMFAYKLFDVRSHGRLVVSTTLILYSLWTAKYGSLVVFSIAVTLIGEIFRELSRILEPSAGLGPLPSFLRVSFVLAFLYTQ